MKFDTILENKNRGSIDWTIPKGGEMDDEYQFYVDGGVVQKNSTLRLMGATSKPTAQICSIRIFRMGWYGGSGARLIYFSNKIEVPTNKIWEMDQPSSPDLAVNGPSWNSVFEHVLPDKWCDGLYVIKIENDDAKATLAPFWLTSPSESEGIAVCFSPINIQARNWWGGYSATQVIGGKSESRNTLYHQIGSKTLSINRPMYNPRTGDFLRWAYPLVRFLERHDIPVTYITDLDIEELGTIPESITHFVTLGPMRYWTKLFDNELTKFCDAEGKTYAHFGAEAGQHIVSYNSESKQIQFHDEYGYERLENPLTGSRPSGSKPRPPWGNMELNPQKKILQGIVGSSWDKSIDKRKVIASGKGRHKLFRRTIAEATLQKKSSVVFNAGVSNWTWALSAFGRQGNILVNEDAQRLTLNLLGQDESILNSNLDTDMILDDDEISTKSLSQLEGILTKKPDNFHALLYSGIRLFEEGRYELAQSRFIRAHQLQPRSILATYRLARNYHKLGDFEPMLPLYHELLRQRPDRYHYVQQYAALLFSLGEEEEGMRSMNYAISLRPNEPAPYVSLGNHERIEGNYELAKAYLEKALELDKTHHSALAGLATLYDNIGDFQTSEKYWKEILRSHPQNERAVMGLGKSLYRHGNYDEAYIYLKSIVKDYSHRYGREAGFYCINIASNHMKNDGEVIELCTHIIDVHIDELANHKNGHIPVTQLALALSRTNQTMEALSLVKKHSSLYRNPSECHLLTAQLYLNQGKTDAYYTAVKQVFTAHGDELISFDSSDEQKRLLVGNLSTKDVPIVDKQEPLVSVIMTVYKHNDLLESAINSVLNQSYQNLELIIIDDCSPDTVYEYLENITRGEKRVKLLQMERNGGTYLAKNRGMSMATGKYVSFHDSDDWLHPSKIEISVSKLEENNDIVAVFSNYFRVDENGNFIFKGIGAVRPACISLTMRREEILTKIGFFDAVRVSADSEYEYRIRTVFGEERVMFLDTPFLIASVRSESLSQGGKFAVGWSGLTGIRLNYRKAYTEWHNSEHFKSNSFIPMNSAEERSFIAPEEILP